MSRKAKVSNEMLQSAMQAAEKAKSADELRMAQAVLIPRLLNVSDEVAGQLIGRSRVTIV